MIKLRQVARPAATVQARPLAAWIERGFCNGTTLGAGAASAAPSARLSTAAERGDSGGGAAAGGTEASSASNTRATVTCLPKIEATKLRAAKHSASVMTAPSTRFDLVKHVGKLCSLILPRCSVLAPLGWLSHAGSARVQPFQKCKLAIRK